MASHSGPSTPWKMAWQKACQFRVDKRRLPSLVSYIRGVNNSVDTVFASDLAR